MCPTGYANEGKTYSKVQHKWIKKSKENAFDYDTVNQESAAFMISFFRAYPDYYADIFRSENASYKLELPQRFMLRILVRYRNVYITGSRGLTKTYVIVLSKMIKGILYPNIQIRYCAPNQKQAAKLATQAFHQIEKDYPDIAGMWQLRSDRPDMFRITTMYGSEFIMYAPKGDNSNEVVAEEIGQEGSEADKFNMQNYEDVILPTVRLERNVNRKKDITHIDLQHSHITNASTKLNRAFSVHRHACLKDMLQGERHDGYVVDIPWEVSVLCNIRSKAYIADQKSRLTASAIKREMCALYSGTADNPMVADDTLTRSRTLMAMEDKHCKKPDAIYIIGVDYAFVDNAKNAKCGIAVLKLTKFNTVEKRDKYLKDFVYVDSYAPPKNSYFHAQKVKNMWSKYCNNGGEPTYIAMDERNGGALILTELIKPSNDGLPNICCYDHCKHTDIEQPNALPIIYPITAGRAGSKDEDGEMIKYAQVEFEQGNIRLLTSDINGGVEQYKRRHSIKDDMSDGKIAYPYRKTDELCQQIANLKTKPSGYGLSEVRISMSIQRDMWSAMKYALRFAQILEQQLVADNYRTESSWGAEIAKFQQGGYLPQGQKQNTVNNLLAKRRR